MWEFTTVQGSRAGGGGGLSNNSDTKFTHITEAHRSAATAGDLGTLSRWCRQGAPTDVYLGVQELRWHRQPVNNSALRQREHCNWW